MLNGGVRRVVAPDRNGVSPRLSMRIVGGGLLMGHRHRVALYDRYGPPAVLYVATAPVPTPKPGEAVVRVHAASISGGDVAARSGAMKMVTGRRFPQRTGIDFAGVVQNIEGSAQFAAGDAVWGVVPHFTFGAVAEFVSVPAQRLARAPVNVELRDAAALPGSGTTALTALKDKARLRQGERLLVRGASGGVGSALVQIGKALGAHVTALAGAPSLDYVRNIGADMALDYRTTDPSHLDVFIAGDDAHAKASLSQFIESLGMRAQDTGDLTMAHWLEGAGLLSVGLANHGVGNLNFSLGVNIG